MTRRLFQIACTVLAVLSISISCNKTPAPEEEQKPDTEQIENPKPEDPTPDDPTPDDPTPDDPQPTPLFSVEVKNNSFIELQLVVTPSDPEMEYFYVVMPSGRFPGQDDAAILKEIHDFYRSIIELGLTDKGEITVTNEDTGSLNPLTEYCLYLYGVERNNPCTELFTFTFTTSDQNDPTNVTFTSNATNITSNGASVSVTPSDNTVLYVWDVVQKSVFDKYGSVEGAFIEKWLGDQVDGSFWKTVEDVVVGCGVRGTQSYDYTTLAAGTEYIVFAVCIDAQGNPVSKAYTSKVFKTENAKVSDVYVYQDMVAYYDGDAMAEENPTKYANYAGKYYVHTKVVVDKGTPANTYAGYVKSDPKDYTDAQIISALVKSGLKNQVDCWFLVEKTGATTYMYTITVADDAKGDFGVVDRYTMYLFAAGCKPISDIL